MWTSIKFVINVALINETCARMIVWIGKKPVRIGAADQPTSRSSTTQRICGGVR
jgi:hypothetical protein